MHITHERSLVGVGLFFSFKLGVIRLGTLLIELWNTDREVYTL